MRRLHGWEPAETTEYEYDESGRLLRSVTTREPEWTPDEVALFLAQRADSMSRNMYGIPMERATARGAKFVADELPTLDVAVDAVSRARNAYYKQHPDAPRDGMIWGVREVTPGE